MKKVFALVVLMLTTQDVYSARAGDFVRVTYGSVVGIQHVRLSTGAGATGAQLGGLAGLATAHGKSSGRKAGNAIAGALIGAMIANAANGKHDGSRFSIELQDGSTAQIVTEQRDIRMGDCVSIEQGRHVNLRRVSTAMCDHPVGMTSAYQDNDIAEAEECQQAKQQLLDAKSEDAATAAGVKVQILCHH